MIFVRLIDENGMFIADEFVNELTEFTIETPCPSGFYHPKWNGESWVEGLSQEEIDELKNQVPEEPEGLQARIEELETMLSVLLGVNNDN